MGTLKGPEPFPLLLEHVGRHGKGSAGRVPIFCFCDFFWRRLGFRFRGPGFRGLGFKVVLTFLI